MYKVSDKLQTAIDWSKNLEQLQDEKSIEYERVIGDAGFREYIRVITPQTSYILA